MQAFAGPSSGQPLPESVRGEMELALGADFSGVQVHSDALADQLNNSLDARAFTTGRDIFFRRGEYSPGSPGGQRLLAHELVHVVQQRAPGRTGPGEGQTSDGVIQRVRRGGSYTFTAVKADLTNVYRPVFLMSTANDAFSDGEDVVVKFEELPELMTELFFSKVAAGSGQKIPDMRRASVNEVTRCKAVVLRDLKKEVNLKSALVMDFVPGRKLELLRTEEGGRYQLSGPQLSNIGRLLAFQIFMGGQDMLPAPTAAGYNFGNVIVSTAPGSSSVSMIDVTPGSYGKNYAEKMYTMVISAVKKLKNSKSGGALTKAVGVMIQKVGTSQNIGQPDLKSIRGGFIQAMRQIVKFDLEELYEKWKAVFPEWQYEDEIEFMRNVQMIYRKLL
jgi:hypothetical protein